MNKAIPNKNEEIPQYCLKLILFPLIKFSKMKDVSMVILLAKIGATVKPYNIN